MRFMNAKELAEVKYLPLSLTAIAMLIKSQLKVSWLSARTEQSRTDRVLRWWEKHADVRKRNEVLASATDSMAWLKIL